MSRSFALIVILVLGVGVLVYFIVKSLLIPHDSGGMANLLKQGKSRAVIKAAKQLVIKNPRNAEAHYWLGAAYHQEKRDELALAELKTVLNLGVSEKDIPEVEFRELLARLLAEQREEEEALKEYLLLIKLMPENGEYYYRAGKLFNQRNRADMAADYLRKAAGLKPRDGNIHCELGIVLYKGKQSREAKAAFDTALKYRCENPARIHYYLGKIQKDGKEYAAAIASFEKAALDGEYRVRALVEKGGCYLAQGAADQAIMDLEQAVAAVTSESGPDSLYARYYLGNCYESRQEIDKALAQWDKVYEQKKNFKDVGEKLLRYRQYRTGEQNTGRQAARNV
jgi:tetratricopeptide (TPR) repeat protein